MDQTQGAGHHPFLPFSAKRIVTRGANLTWGAKLLLVWGPSTLRSR
jgi:hypothetical protein